MSEPASEHEPREPREQPFGAVEPETVERTIYVEDRRPRFVLGLIVGAVLLAGGVALLADEDGSYQTAGQTATEMAAPAQDAPR